MNPLQLLRTMHAETRVRLKTLLAEDDPARARQQWQALRPVLDLHEQLEDRFLYAPLREELGPGTPLGDYADRHDGDVAIVQRLIGATDELDPARLEWRTSVATLSDVLARHVVDEEGQVFGRIEQAWDAQRLEDIGTQMAQQIELASKPVASSGARRK